MAKRRAPAIPQPSKSAADTRRVMAKLATQHPNADTELRFRNAYELLVATILSAQCTDARVNTVTPALFERYPDARALAKATTDDLEPRIQSTGFFRAKSRSLVGMATELVARHGGAVPKTMDALVALPGVGRKTANVVLGHALGVPGLPVDRHVLRVSNRIGIARAEDPEVVERQLCAATAPKDWTRTSDTLILHGRRICKPKPLCDRCAVRDLCDYYRSLGTKAAPKVRRSESGSLADGPRAPRARGRRESGSLLDEPRAPKARGRHESGSLVDEPRAPKARGTGRGGGAPRQGKK